MHKKHHEVLNAELSESGKNYPFESKDGPGCFSSATTVKLCDGTACIVKRNQNEHPNFSGLLGAPPVGTAG